MPTKELSTPYTLTAEAWATIKPIIITLNRLRPPAQLPVDFTIPAYANRTRDWLYRYFKEMNQKHLYKIRKDSPVRISILCAEPIVAGLGPVPIYDKVESFVQEHLSVEKGIGQYLTEDEAREIVQAHLDNGQITADEFLLIMDEFREKILGMKEIAGNALDSLPDAETLFSQPDQQAGNASEPSLFVPKKKSFELLDKDKDQDESIKWNDTALKDDPEGGETDA